MKITFVMGFFLPVPPLLGGATEKTCLALARWLAARGHDVTLISRTWPGLPDEEERDGVKYLRMPGASHSKHLFLNLLQDARWNLALARRMPAADVIVSNSVLLPLLFPLLQRHPPPIVQWAARMPKGQAALWKNARLVLAISRSVGEKIRTDASFLRDRVRFVPFPIDYASLRAAAMPRRPDAPFHFGYAGRIHPEKGIGLLIQAANRLGQDSALPAWKFSLVGAHDIPAGGGGPEYLANLRAMIDEPLRSRVVFHGPLNDAADLARFYAGLDVFCYPSLAAQGEALGVAPLEAMAAGAIPIVSNLDCFHDFVRDGENGLVFEASGIGAADILAGKLRALLERPAWLAQAADAAARTAALYDVSAVGQALESALNEARG